MAEAIYTHVKKSRFHTVLMNRTTLWMNSTMRGSITILIMDPMGLFNQRVYLPMIVCRELAYQLGQSPTYASYTHKNFLRLLDRWLLLLDLTSTTLTKTSKQHSMLLKIAQVFSTSTQNLEFIKITISICSVVI